LEKSMFYLAMRALTNLLKGMTGVPIVDAGIRQMNTMGKWRTLSVTMWYLHVVSGWMHNRVRMITASYLTKDLMLDWRLGEKVCACTHSLQRFVDTEFV
jgi:deoxyribodipyrimidine photo-lyase